jgi:hypothetical protein
MEADWKQGSFCKDGWISYRWNRTPKNPYPKHDFEIFLNPPKPTKLLSIDEAARKTVEDICQTYKNKKIFLAMSGGVDSEYIATILCDMKISFTPIIVHIEHYNQIDYQWAHSWCKNNNIDPIVHDLSLSDYILKFIKYTKKYYTRKGSAAAMIETCANLARERNGILIGGCGIHELYIPDPIMFAEAVDPTLKDKIGYLFNEADLLKHFVASDMPIMFYNWSPEILLSYAAARDSTLTTEENRFKLFKCTPRPKYGAITTKWKTFSEAQHHPLYEKAVLTASLSISLGSSDSYYLGTTEKLIKILKHENI